MSDKTVVIHQPDFMPYLGYFDRLLHADTLVVLETVQFERGSHRFMNRDKIKTERGDQWFNLCIKKTARDTAIKDIELVDDGGKWKKNNLGLFHQHYRKAPFYKEILPYLEKLYARDDKLFWTFSFASIEMLMDLFDVHPEVIFSSDINPQGKNNDLIVDIMHKVGATRYLSGVGAEDYFDPKVYEEAGIEVIWQDFKHPTYPQQYPELGFIPYLSSLDLLFNCGIEQSRKILRGEG